MELGNPYTCEVTRSGSPHLSCKIDQLKMRDYMDRRIILPKRVTSPSWGTPPSCKQALTESLYVEVCALRFLKMARKCPAGLLVHCKNRAFSIQPKILDTSTATSIGTGHFGFV